MSFQREGSCQKELQNAATRGTRTIHIRAFKLLSFTEMKIEYESKNFQRKLEGKYIINSDVQFAEEIILSFG